ncbi:glucokinase [Halolactibacillus alkaliphilus]|uniref:Glucokinase n=1 Tax=Halolactibacillus alkaliphilus TaxID=442899 RepID=A0A511WWS3_9BACI|nr:ROK family protein [Halolactibacillus alkaliphilus]GEN55575.1 glucokinase [Halolactibacillus alkaliphilus]GGN63940.1 glucokinase [Halolactibacillus alkaliphilus]SFO62150.1 glucokinase [Halolactibacillus alkaliphilus]
MNKLIGIDIGGTKVAIGLLNINGTLLARKTIPTDQSLSPEAMIKEIYQQTVILMTENNTKKEHLLGVGIGAPGPIDTKTGQITSPPNLPTWRNIPVVELFRQHFHLPIYFENDASAAALAEKWLGAGREESDFVYMTISTGIGAGIYSNNQLLTGSKGNAGDIGHTVFDPSFGKCVCGQSGCLEHIASGTAIAREGSRLTGTSLSTHDVFSLYKEGHPQITDYLTNVFTTLGAACVTLINTFEPNKIIIGGGVSNVGDTLFLPIRDYVSQYALNPANRNTPIVPAELNQDAGVIGAAALVLSNKLLL